MNCELTEIKWLTKIASSKKMRSKQTYICETNILCVTDTHSPIDTITYEAITLFTTANIIHTHTLLQNYTAQ